MPELPEVETVVRYLRKPLIGRTIESVWYDWERVIQTPSPVEFADRIIGQTFRAINRRAKFVVCELDHDYFIVHLRMTGRLFVTDANESWDTDRWVHFRLDLDNGKQLRFSDSRKFGRVYLTNYLETVTQSLGPEPLEPAFTIATFQNRLAGRTKQIKALLLDQTFVAGVGNIYADEALFHAGIHPQVAADRLTEAQQTALHDSIRDTLNAGIDYEGASISWYRKPDGSAGSSQKHFLVYGREGQPCFRCGTIIQKIRVAQRGTHFCPTCQAVIGVEDE